MAPKNVILAQADGLVLLILDILTWIASSTTFSLSCYLLWTNILGCAVCTWIAIGIILFVLLYFKPLWNIDFWVKTSLHAYSHLQIMHRNTCSFTKSTCKPSLTTKNPQHINKLLWGLQGTTWASTTSYEISSFDMLGVCKCIFNI